MFLNKSYNIFYIISHISCLIILCFTAITGLCSSPTPVPGHLGPGAAGVRAATSLCLLRCAALGKRSASREPPRLRWPREVAAFWRQPRGGPSLQRKFQRGGDTYFTPACANDLELIHMVFWYAKNQK